MPAFNFPASPVDGQVYEAGGFRYQWDAAGQTWRSAFGGEAIASALPDGGTVGQVLTKKSSVNGDALFEDLPAPPPEPEVIVLACSDETTPITATGTKLTFRMPFAMNLTEVRASLRTACATGTFTADINEGGATILSTKLTLDAGEKTSTTAAAPAVISDGALANDAEITVTVSNVGDGTGTGLKVTLIGTRA